MQRNGITIAFLWIWIVLAVSCILYGMKVLSVESGTGFYIVWLALGVIFLFFAGAEVFFFLPYGVLTGGLCVRGGISAGAVAPAAAV